MREARIIPPVSFYHMKSFILAQFALPKNGFSQLPLKVGVAMQVGSGQWEVRGNDVCDFKVVTFKGKSILSPFAFHPFSG